MAFWGVWEERVGARASRAGPTVASRPATPALGIHGGSRRGSRREKEEREEREEKGMEKRAVGRRSFVHTRDRSHGKQQRTLAIGKKNRNMLTPVGTTKSSSLSYQWLYIP